MSEPLTDAWIDSVLRQFQESYGLSLLGHPDRLRAFARDWSSAQDAARRAKDGSPKGRDACGSGPQDRQPGPQDAPKTEGGAQEGVPAEVLTTCNCRWRGEKLVQQCTLHEAWKDAIHDWAGRAKAAEQRLQALATHPAPAQEAPKAPLGHDMRERIAEAHDASLDDDHTGCRAILKECLRLLDATPPAQEAPEPTEAEIDLCRELAGLPAKIALPSGAEYDIRPGIYRLVGHLMVRAKYAPAPQEAPQAETPAAWQSRVNLGGRWTEWKECAPLADDEPRELVSDGRVAYQFRPLYATPQAPQESAGRHLLPVQLPDGRIVKMRKCDLIGTDQMAFCDFDALPPQVPQESKGVVPLTDQDIAGWACGKDESRFTLRNVLVSLLDGDLTTEEAQHEVSNLIRAALAATRAEPAEPLFYISERQIPAHLEGKAYYMPYRVKPEGLFQFPLYAAPQVARAEPAALPSAEPTSEMLDAFQRGFQEQLRIRDKARFKPNPTPREQMSAEKAGLLAMLKVARAEPAGGRVEEREALQKIIAAYDAYRGRGVAPAPVEYTAVRAAIEAARAALTQPPKENSRE